MIFAIIMATAFTTFARAPKFHYVLTSNGAIYCSKINMGANTTRVITTDGKRMDISNIDIYGYSKNGNIRMKMPEMKNNQPTGKMVWMQLLATRNGFSIYRQDYFLPSGQAVTDMFVFEGSRYVLQVDKRNSPTVLSFFGVE